MYTSENNWYYWSYGSLPPFSRQSKSLQFKTTFTNYTGTISTFKDELHKAAASSIDHATDKITLLFSGGADSEVMLRAFLDVGYIPNVVIIRYENDYNLYDVSYAVTICSILNVAYSIIDFNLKKFYENDAERISELSQIDRPRALPYCRLLELVDGFPIMGASDLSPMRLSQDYDHKSQWIMRCWEHDIGWSKFLRAIDKQGIAEWFKWTPGLVVSYMDTVWFKNLVSDYYYGKIGSNSTKIIGYRESYPNLIDRKKQTGFEKIDHLVVELENYFITKYNGLPYRQTVDRTIYQLKSEIINNCSLHLSKEIK